MISRKFFLLNILFILNFSINANAASFDCSKASLDIERIICNNPDISMLDESLSSAYKAHLIKTSDPDKVKQDQKKWLKKRNACHDAECIRSFYKIRLSELSPQKDKLRELFSRIQLSDYYSTFQQKVPDLCHGLLESLKKWEGVEIFEPIATADSINDPIFREYLGKCDMQKLIRSVQIEPRIWDANNLDSLTKEEREEYGTVFIMQKGFRLYQANIDNSKDGSNEFLLYGSGTIQEGDNESDTSIKHSNFVVIEVKNCRELNSAQVVDVTNKPNSFVGLLKYKNRTYIFDVDYYPNESLYGISIKQWEYSPNTKITFFSDVCNFVVRDK